MKWHNYSVVRISILAVMFPLVSIASNFVPVNEANVLVITHSQLRTSNWIPEMDGAWETELLRQKEMQGYTVALLQIQDGVNQIYIRNYLLNNQGSFQFVYILGDAHRPENENPQSPSYPPANYADGNIVPIWREVVTTFWQAYDGLFIVENDRGYIDDIPGVSIGRIPVQSQQEILDYLDKSLYYMSQVDQVQQQPPPWTHHILEVLDDISHTYNLCSGGIVQDYTDGCEEEFPSGWSVLRLSTEEAYANPQLDEPEERQQYFENQLNNGHYGLIHVLGTSGTPEHLVDWYYGTSAYSFNNFQHLPFMFGMSCDLGGFDQYFNGFQKECAIEKLLLHPGGGIVGSVTATGPTLQVMNGVYALNFWKTIFTDGYVNFGEILNRSIELCEGTYSVGEFTLKMMVLLGDPTLDLPYTPFVRGRWTQVMSPIDINETMTVPEGNKLIIDPGVQVRFSPGAMLIVQGALICEGTSTEPIQLIRQGEVGYWGGIKFEPTSQCCELNHVNISDASIALRVIGSDITLTGCHLDNNYLGIAALNNASIETEYSDIINSASYGAVITNNSACHFVESTISGNQRAGIWCTSYGRADLDHCGINNNGDGTEVWHGGLKATCGTLDLYCTGACNNNGPGIASIGSFIDMCVEFPFHEPVSGVNHIENNIPTQMGWFPGQIYVDMSWLLALDYGHNSIVDNGDINRKLIIAWQNPDPPVDWEHNYWGTTDVQLIQNRLNPIAVNIIPIDMEPTYCNPDAPPKSTPEDPAKLLFYQAWMEENLSQFETAILHYQQIIQDYPESPQAKMAVDRIVFCNKASAWSWQEVRNYFLNLADTTSDQSMKFTAKNAAAWCLVQMEQYAQAQVEFTALIDMSQTTADSVKIAINQLMAELEASGLDTILTVPPPGLGREIPGVEALVASDRELRIILTADELLRSFNIGGSSSISKYSGVPEIYSLEQNYPNPFNSETVIRYGLPEAGHVEITVYNVLGQKVATLLDASQSAGFHKILWNGQSKNGQCLASGMYFYCIKANNFMNVKKMVLLR